MLLSLLLACAAHSPPTAAAGAASTEVPVPAEPAPSAEPAPTGLAALPEGWRGTTLAEVATSPSDPTLGPADARFTIVSFADYFCPYCAAFWPQIRAFAEANPDVRVVLKNWPIDNACNPAVDTERHRFACLAAEAAECAARVGRSKDMADVLYLYPEHVTPPEMPLFAEKLGMDVPAFTACMADPAILEAVRLDIQAGIDAGLAGTPSIYVKGIDPDGWVDVAPRIDVLDTVLAAVRAGETLPK